MFLNDDKWLRTANNVVAEVKTQSFIANPQYECPKILKPYGQV